MRALDHRTRRAVARAIESLANDPHRGKPLRGALAGYVSIRAVRDRYRVVCVTGRDVVEVAMIGERRPGDRKDVYAKLSRLLAGTD